MLTILFTDTANNTTGIMLVDSTDGGIIRHAVEQNVTDKAFLVVDNGFVEITDLWDETDVNALIFGALELLKSGEKLETTTLTKW